MAGKRKHPVKKIKSLTGKVSEIDSDDDVIIDLHSGAGTVYLPHKGRTAREMKLEVGDKLTVTFKVDKRAKE